MIKPVLTSLEQLRTVAFAIVDEWLRTGKRPGLTPEIDRMDLSLTILERYELTPELVGALIQSE